MTSEILQFLLTIPLQFTSNDLIKITNQPSCTYALKGMICQQSNGHYLAFFRRMATKQKVNLVYIQEHILNQEVNLHNEWTLFNDAEIASKGVWKDVVSQCLTLKAYPTALFYEKIDPSQDIYDPNLSAVSLNDINKLMQLHEQQSAKWGSMG